MLHNKKNNEKNERHAHEKPHEAADGKVELDQKEYEELVKKAGECDAYHDKCLRTQAEFENARKRMERDKIEHIKFANEDIISELLGILDNFERGVKSAESAKDFDLLHQGVEMIVKQLHGLLEERGLKRINSAGEKFDPFKHEALEIVEGDAEKDGLVAEELQSGYELNGRVIRSAKVRVVKAREEGRGERDEEGRAQSA